MSLHLDWCSHEAAKYAVEHWHYSKRMPSGRNNYIGVWENDKYIGSFIYGYSISPHLGSLFGLKQTEVTELKRISLREHENPVTKMIARSIKMIVNKNPSLRLLVSFADTEQGHLGGIYQASNWVYVGVSIVQQMLINGRWRNDVHANRMSGYPKRKAPAKHKYLYPLDNEMKKQIEPLRQPYPKRGRGEIDNAPDSNRETGGASPTRPLLESEVT